MSSINIGLLVVAKKDNWSAAKALEFLRPKIISALTTIGNVVCSAAQANARVVTGFLHDNINSEVNEKELFVRISSDAEYSSAVEFGTGEKAEDGKGRQGGWVYFKDDRFYFTKGQKSQPFMRPALNNNKKNIKEILAKITQ